MTAPVRKLKVLVCGDGHARRRAHSCVRLTRFPTPLGMVPLRLFPSNALRFAAAALKCAPLADTRGRLHSLRVGPAYKVCKLIRFPMLLEMVPLSRL